MSTSWRCRQCTTVYLVFLYQRHPDRVRETGRVFFDEQPAALPVPPREASF